MPYGILAVFPWASLLAGILLQLLLARFLTGRGKGWLAFAASIVALGGVLALWPSILHGQALDMRLSVWDGPASLAYHIDGLSLLFAFIAAAIGATVLLYSIDYMADDPSATRFYVLMLAFIAGMVHLVFCSDLLVLYLSWEVIGLCSFLLVGFWYRQKEAASGARKVLVMTHIAGYGLLATVIVLYARTGSTLWTDPQVTAAFGSGLFLLTLVAAIAKSVQFPLHTWIPDAMAAPTPVSALLHAACYVKAGVYLIARLHSLGTWPAAWQTTVVWIGTITLLVGVLFAIVQSDLKRLLAFHTVSQIGYMVLGLGLGTPLGIAAGLLHCLNHALFKGGLFLCAGVVEHATGTRDMDRLGGLIRRLPATGAFWLVLAGSISGVPLLSGFVSKWLLYNAALEAGQVVPALISWIVSVLTVFSFLKATTGVFFGEEIQAVKHSQPALRTMLAGTGILAAGSVLLGFAPQLAMRYLINPVLPALGLSPVTGISWLGLTVGGGSWLATGGLVLALVAVGVGAGIYMLMRPARQMVIASATAFGEAGGVFTGGEPLAGQGRLPASDFSLMVRQGLEPFYRWANPDVYYLSLWRALVRLGQGLGRVSAWLEHRVISATLVLAGLLAAATALLAPVGVPSGAELPQVIGWRLPAALGLALLCLLLAATSLPNRSTYLLMMAVSGLLAVSGLFISSPVTRILILEGATLLALVLVWLATSDRKVAWAYLLAVFLSALATLLGTLFMSAAPGNLLLALFLVGVALKLALVPLYMWLPLVAEAVPAPLIGLVVALIDIAAFGEFLALRVAAPWIFSPAAPWLVLALISTVGGAGLMLAQRDLKRLLAFSSIEDMGYLLLAATLGGELGLNGALLGAIVHALGKAMLFASLSKAETDGLLKPGVRSLAARYPLSGAGFALGALAILGFPPTLGYIARWRIYTVAANTSPWLLGALLLASALALLAYARALAVTWWGAGERAQEKHTGEVVAVREPLPLAIALLCVGMILLLAGLWPRLLGV